MRLLLKLLVVLGALVAAVWIGGEVSLARQATAVIADDPQLQAAAVRELREPGRVGVRIEQLGIDRPGRRLDLPWLDLWARPQRLNEVHVSLPQEAGVTLSGRRLDVTAEAAEVSARFAPAHAMALTEAQVRTGGVVLDGQPLAERLNLVLHLAGYGADAPRGTGAAYDVTADMVALSLPALTDGALQGAVHARGGGRLWLDSAPARGGSARTPRLVGLRADGLEIGLDDLGLRLWGRVVADAEGRLNGQVLVDTADGEGFIARAVSLGMLPQAMAPLAATMLAGLGSMDIASEGSGQPSDSSVLPARSAAEAAARHSHPAAAAFPPPGPGELRIPLSFREGRTFLGPIAIGPAPQIPR